MNEDTKVEVKSLWLEYAPPDDDSMLFSEEDEKTLLLKQIIATGLTTFDKTIILLYVEKGSLRQVAKILDVSQTAIAKKMDQIKLNIMDQFYGKMKNKLDRQIDKKIKDERYADDN